MTNAIAGYGTLLQAGDGAATEVFATIAEVKDISGPGLEMTQEEATSHDSTNGWREFVSTLADGGEVSFEVNFIPTDGTQDASTGLIADFEARTLRNFQLVFPDTGSTTWGFAANVSGFEPAEPVDGLLTASVTLKISGEPTLV